MADLKGALLAAAEEADKMQRENQNRFDNLEHYTQYVEGEQERLKKKLKTVSDVVRQLADILSED